MSSLRQKQYFPVVLLLLLSSVLMGGGCVGDSSSSGVVSDSKVISATPATPDEVGLESQTKTLESMKSVSVPVRIAVSEPIQNLLCVMQIVKGGVAYDPTTFRVTDSRYTSRSAARGAEEDDDSWIATTLIPNVTPGQTEYTATFDLLNAIDGNISGQLHEGLDGNAIFNIDEDPSDGFASDFFYVGPLTTPANAEEGFTFEVGEVEVGSPYLLLPASGDTITGYEGWTYDPTDPQAANAGIFLGIPVSMRLTLQNTALTSITLKSPSATGNVDFVDMGQVKTLTKLFAIGAASVDFNGFTDAPSELVLPVVKTPLQRPLNEGEVPDDEYVEDDTETGTFGKQALGDDSEVLGVSFLLGVKVTGGELEALLNGLSNDRKRVALQAPIAVEGKYVPDDAISDASLAEGKTWTRTANSTISDDKDLFTEDLCLLLEEALALKNAQQTTLTSSRAVLGSGSVYDYDSDAIWSFGKSYRQSAGNKKYFHSGVDASGKVYVRTFGAGLKLTAKVPLHILDNETYVIDAAAAAFMGDATQEVEGYEAASSAIGVNIKAFGTALFDQTYDITTSSKTLGQFSATKEQSERKWFYEFLIPIRLRAGARGQLGIKPEIAYDASLNDLSLYIVPFVDTSATGGVEFDALLIRAGIEVKLRLIKYEFRPSVSFSLAFPVDDGSGGVGIPAVGVPAVGAPAVGIITTNNTPGIRTRLTYSIDNQLSSLDGRLKLYFDRRKYLLAGEWVRDKNHDLLNWSGINETWNIYRGTIVDRTFWLQAK